MNRNVNAVVFDLDGTLLNTKDVIAHSLSKLLHSFGVNVSVEEIRGRVHRSPYETVCEYFPINRSKFREKYWVLYRMNINFSLPYGGVRELLETLRRRGYKIGVATSLPEHYARSGLQIASIEELVDCVVAYHDTVRHKPHPDPIIEAARRLGLNPPRTLYVGDLPDDIEAGRAAGSYTGAAIWDLNRDDKVRTLSHKPNYCFKYPKEILSACGEQAFLLPCIFTGIRSRIYKNCCLLDKIQPPDVYALREQEGVAFIRNFLSLSEQERVELMDACSKCFKRVVLELPENHCFICQNIMTESQYRRFEGRCYSCNSRHREGSLYFDRVFTIGQERGNLDYAIKAFKGVKGPPNVGLAIPLGLIVANWLFEHRGELENLGVDIIIPIPSSERRIEEVGFDHISTILVVVQSLVNFMGIKFTVLARSCDVPLKGLTREERAEAIRGAFDIEDEDEMEAVQGKAILILDDVFTTGATTNECAHFLKENGLSKVYVLAIARARGMK